MGLLPRLGILLACVAAAAICIVWMTVLCLFGSANIDKRFMRIAVGLDCAVSATFGGDGYTTISKRAALAMQNGDKWGCVLCKWLDKVDKGHCDREL